jgi:hypothetical protein
MIAPRSPTTQQLRRSAGFWLVIVLIAYLMFSFVRSLVGPESLSTSFGLTRTDGASAYVQVYGIRTFFLGLYGAVLLVRRDIQALTLFVLVAVMIPLGDAVLLVVNNGSASAIAKNVAIAIVLVVAWRLLKRLCTPGVAVVSH